MKSHWFEMAVNIVTKPAISIVGFESMTQIKASKPSKMKVTANRVHSLVVQASSITASIPAIAPPTKPIKSATYMQVLAGNALMKQFWCIFKFLGSKATIKMIAYRKGRAKIRILPTVVGWGDRSWLAWSWVSLWLLSKKWCSICQQILVDKSKDISLISIDYLLLHHLASSFMVQLSGFILFKPGVVNYKLLHSSL